MKFPTLPAAGALTGAEIVPLTQGGVDKRTTAQDIADLAPLSAAPIVTLSGTTYTLDDLTSGSWHVFDNAALVTITVMNDETEPVAANSEFGIDAKGAAGVSLVSDDLAVITPQPDSTLALAQHDFAVLKRIAADDYRLIGSTVAP